jgi:hypothetical protein
MGERRNACKVFMGKPKRTVVAWKTYILKGQSAKMVLKETGWQGMD